MSGTSTCSWGRLLLARARDIVELAMRTEESLKAMESNELSGTFVIGAGKVAAFGCPAAQALIHRLSGT